MAIRIQLRRGTAAEWTAANPVLATGEQGYETDTGKTKVGDGVTAWASLPYPVDDAAAAAVAPVTPGPGEVIVGTASGPVATPVESIGVGTIIPDDTPYVLVDRFRGVDGTKLSTHAPDIGDTWVNYGTGVTIVGNAATSDFDLQHSVQPNVGVNVATEIIFDLGTTFGVGVLVRAVDASNYWFVWIDAGSKTFRIFQRSAGTNAIRAGGPVPELVQGRRYTLRVEALGPNIVAEIVGLRTLQWDGVPETGAGVGLRIGAGGGRVIHMTAHPATIPAVPTLPAVTATNAAAPLVMPTMYGDTQGAHPDVLDMGAGGWNGYRYWMAYTPLTDGLSTQENPTLAVSNDLTTWVAPPGVRMPLVDKPSTSAAFHSDTDLAFLDGTMYVIYRTSHHPNTNDEYLSVMESRDGETWSDPVVILRGNDSRITTPAVLYRRGQWHMWTITTATPDRYRMEYRTAASIYGPWGSPRQCVMPMPGPKIDMWHINVHDMTNRLVGIFSSADRTTAGAGALGDLYYAESFDGVHWNLTPEPVLVHGVNAWESDKLYRAALVPKPGGYELLYSARSTAAKWGIGRTTMTLTP